jgi:glutamyl-tRNA reductase
MSVLVVGLSHKSAPVALLERAAITGEAIGKLLRDVHLSEHVAGAFVVSTCNRVEVYAEVEKFHGGVSTVSDLLARHAGVDLAQLTRHLYVHYEERAIHHLFAVACGLDSMVVGEGQILGQVRQALKFSAEAGTLGRALAELGRLALHAGKRARTETAIDRVGASMVSVGIDLVLGQLGRRPGVQGNGHGWPAAAVSTPRPAGHAAVPIPPPDPLPQVPGDSRGPASLAGARVLVVGAGSMSALAATTAMRAGADRIVIANRTPSRAQRLAVAVGGSTAGMADLPSQLAAADLVISCTAAAGAVVTAEVVRQALAARAAADQDRAGVPRGPIAFIDLALPHDVDPEVAGMPGALVVGLAEIGATSRADAPGAPGTASHDEDIAAVRRIVAEEVAAHASAVQAARVTPTVVALRAKAAMVVDAELTRLAGRLTAAGARELDEIAQAMRRVVDKLLHAPTVRVKELAGSPGGDAYAAALRELFDLDPKAVEAVTRADADLGGELTEPAEPAEGES